MAKIIETLNCHLSESIDEEWGKSQSQRLPGGKFIGGSLYELPPGGFTCYHFHHGEEEILIVLKGRPTLRSIDGEQQLQEGSYVHFGLGLGGAHGLKNETDQVARFIMVSNRAVVDAVEYPDTEMLSVMAHSKNQFGKPLWDMRKVHSENEN